MDGRVKQCVPFPANIQQRHTATEEEWTNTPQAIFINSSTQWEEDESHCMKQMVLIPDSDWFCVLSVVSHRYLDYLTNWPQYGYKTVGRTRLSVAQGLSREEFWLPSFSLSTLQTSQTTQPTSKSSLTIWRGWREYKELIQGFVGWCQWYWNAGKNKELVMDFHRCKLYFLWSITVQYQYC